MQIADFIADLSRSALAPYAARAAWDLTSGSDAIVAALIETCGDAYDVRENVAVHRSAQVEAGAVIKAPAIIGPDCFVSSTVLVRGRQRAGRGRECRGRRDDRELPQ
jgi:UDP-3-O-[3-hydroxymyristoyl] glucosamine N-acyltransferase